MIVRLSISSSNDRLPTGNWLFLWLGITFLFFIGVYSAEMHIRHLGWRPSVADSAELWIEQRKLASAYGKAAIILVGASRIQLGVDLDAVKELTGLQPVQLAIDGTAYVPVLENLANDLSITGTIVVSVNASSIRRGNQDDTSTRWVNYYDTIQDKGVEPYKIIHNKVASLLNSHLVMRLQGAKPITVIKKLAFSGPSGGNYLITHPTRSRDADYAKVKMPQFYAGRLQRHFGGKPLIAGAISFKEFIDTYQKAISKSEPMDLAPFNIDLDYLLSLTKKIEKRGGSVIFVRFPSDKLVWEIDEKRYPKKLFWSKMSAYHSKSIHFKDFPSLSKYSLPDGSHIDFRDKVKFTQSLFSIFIEKHWIIPKQS
jgi:hypothetical protein